MIDLIYPYSYLTIWFGVLLGIGFTTACAGLFSAAIVIICIYLGMIRIMPLFSFINRLFRGLIPEEISSVERNIKESFKMTGNAGALQDEGKYIFMWHPHGVFPTSLYFHTATSLTDSPNSVKQSKTVAFNNLQWLPFTTEIFHETSIIPSEYHIMKNALQENSISLSPGGMREMLYEDTTLLSRRRGIFKMALETGTPLVPIISKGEEHLLKAIEIPMWIQDYLKPYDLCIPVPTWKTFIRCLGILQHPLKDPVISVIGEPIPVEKVEQPTEEQISELRQKYIEALKAMYKKEIGRDLNIL